MIKKFKNIYAMGVIITFAVLFFAYLLKFIYPEKCIEIACSKNVCKIGNYIDNHKWAWYVASSILSFITYYFYCGACCGKKHLNYKENLIICIIIILGYVVQKFLPKQYNAVNFSSLIVLPWLFKGQLKNTAICFTSLQLLQTITLEIRDLAFRIADFNYASLIVLMIDYYIATLLFYFLFNYKKGG